MNTVTLDLPVWNFTPEELQARVSKLEAELTVLRERIAGASNTSIRVSLEYLRDTLTVEQELCSKIAARKILREHMRRIDSDRIRYLASRRP